VMLMITSLPTVVPFAICPQYSKTTQVRKRHAQTLSCSTVKCSTKTTPAGGRWLVYRLDAHALGAAATIDENSGHGLETGPSGFF
ncbi:MAG TPA: hypothetical protein VL334_19665, partial [Anaerolineae bacterium]|nr:hypothetical protein [Anaerolineae bacterium]